MSGKEWGLWVYKNWPMDVWATVFFMIVLVVISIALYSRLHTEAYANKRDACINGLLTFAWGVGMTIISPWLMFRALGFSKNGGNRYHFDPIKFFFNLACFTGILLLFGSGRTMEGVCIGPNVEDKAAVVRVVKKVTKKRRRRRTQKHKHKARYRCWAQADKVSTDPISFYSLMMILLFMGMFYYRHDLKEGDRANGLAQIIDAAGRIMAIRYGGAAAAPPVIETVEVSASVPPAAGGRSGSGKPIVSVADDPFVR